MPQEQQGTRERQRTDIREPHRYKVIIYNDDFTPMDFVVKVLRVVFRKDESIAQSLMMKVHHEGSAIVGTYTLDIAASKANKTSRMAKLENHPLKVTVELA
jgi:ATP-dependent Clp protease adaptor protein ClpS